MLLPIGLGTFAAVLVGAYFQWNKRSRGRFSPHPQHRHQVSRHDGSG